MDVNDEEKMNAQLNENREISMQLQNGWSEQIMEHFTKANLFIICCVSAGLLLIAYLAAFSCEVSWILEAHGDLPTPAYLLCAGFFVMFVASTVLIHGLVTGLSWGLFSWSIIIGLLSIPELAFVMIMTTQHWGLQSTHGLTELVGYLLRLIINCVALLCVIPTALKWRREVLVLSQLQNLAVRLQLQTPPPTTPISYADSNRLSKRRRRSRRSSAFDNPAFLVNENGVPGIVPICGQFGSRNEFNASIFGLHPGQYIGPNTPSQLNAKRTQSLVDLRYAIPNMYCSKAEFDEENRKYMNNNIEFMKNVNETKNNEDLSIIDGSSDPIYCTIDSKNTKLSRNCVSLENLGGITKIKNDLSYGNNLLQNYNYWPMIYPMNYQQHAHLQNFPFHYYNYQIPFHGSRGMGYGGYTNPYANRNSSTNSKQSLGNESDDYRKYRDVAL